jgi:predicted HicB family RNase H-like nuclease
MVLPGPIYGVLGPRYGSTAAGIGRDGERIMDDETTVKLNLRLDPQTHRQLTDEAREALRSLNNEIIWRLRQTLRQATLG